MGNEYALPFTPADPTPAPFQPPTGVAPTPVPYPVATAPAPPAQFPSQQLNSAVQRAQQIPIDPLQVALTTGFAMPPTTAAAYSRLIRGGLASRLIARPPNKKGPTRDPLDVVDPRVESDTAVMIRNEVGASPDLAGRLANAAINYSDSPYRKYAERANAERFLERQRNQEQQTRLNGTPKFDTNAGPNADPRQEGTAADLIEKE